MKDSGSEDDLLIGAQTIRICIEDKWSYQLARRKIQKNVSSGRMSHFVSSASQSLTEQTLTSITRDLQFSCPLVVITSLAGLLAVCVVSAHSVGSQDISRPVKEGLITGGTIHL